MKLQNVYNKLLETTIFYYVFYNSLFYKFYTDPIFFNVRYIILGLMGIMLLYKIFIIHDKYKYITLIALAIFELMLYLCSQPSFFPFIAAYAIYMTIPTILQSYMKGMIIGVLITVLMSIMGALPQNYPFLSLGFSNPNTLGFYLAIIAITFLVLHWNRRKIYYILFYLIILFINNFILDDKSASISMLIFLFMYVFTTSKKLTSIIVSFSCALPSFLVFLVFLLGKLYPKYIYSYKLNEIFSHRLELWNYFLLTYPVKSLPQNINFAEINKVEWQIWGNSSKSYMGVLDGAYINLLIQKGMLITLMTIVLLTIFLYILGKNNMKAYFYLTLTILLFGFSETAPITYTSFYQSYILIIAIVILAQGEIYSRNKTLINYFEREKYGI